MKTMTRNVCAHMFAWFVSLIQTMPLSLNSGDQPDEQCHAMNDRRADVGFLPHWQAGGQRRSGCHEQGADAVAVSEHDIDKLNDNDIVMNFVLIKTCAVAGPEPKPNNVMHWITNKCLPVHFKECARCGCPWTISRNRKQNDYEFKDFVLGCVLLYLLSALGPC